MNAKTLIPKPLRTAYRQLKRNLADHRAGLASKMAKRRFGAPPQFGHSVIAEQPIIPSAYFENKIHNMQTAGHKINQVLILPGEVFSFWDIVGHPGPAQGFKKGRNLVGGAIRGGYGGGLCQVSGIVYYLALGAGLEILERHNHSIDIYAEHERFAPLGADATVAFAYKDLRFKNNSTQPLCLHIAADTKRLVAQLSSPEPLIWETPVFERQDEPLKRTVVTKVNGEVVAVSRYGVS